MTFPLLFTVGRHAYTGSPMDGNGDRPKVYSPPKDQPGTVLRVYGWGPPLALRGAGESRPMEAQERVVVDIELLVPPDFPATERDLIDLPSGPAGQFEVIGVPNDYSKGPFGWQPGKVINLRKVDG